MKHFIVCAITVLTAALAAPTFAQVSDFASYLFLQKEATESGKRFAVYLYSAKGNAPNTFETVIPDDPAIRKYLEDYCLVVSIDGDTEFGK